MNNTDCLNVDFLAQSNVCKKMGKKDLESQTNCVKTYKQICKNGKNHEFSILGVHISRFWTNSPNFLGVARLHSRDVYKPFP